MPESSRAVDTLQPFRDFRRRPNAIGHEKRSRDLGKSDAGAVAFGEVQTVGGTPRWRAHCWLQGHTPCSVPVGLSSAEVAVAVRTRRHPAGVKVAGALHPEPGPARPVQASAGVLAAWTIVSSYTPNSATLPAGGGDARSCWVGVVQTAPNRPSCRRLSTVARLQTMVGLGACADCTRCTYAHMCTPRAAHFEQVRCGFGVGLAHVLLWHAGRFALECGR